MMEFVILSLGWKCFWRVSIGCGKANQDRSSAAEIIGREGVDSFNFKPPIVVNAINRFPVIKFQVCLTFRLSGCK